VGDPDRTAARAAITDEMMDQALAILAAAYREAKTTARAQGHWEDCEAQIRARIKYPQIVVEAT
jgi:hypothetical protein